MDFGKVVKWGAATGAAYFIYSVFRDLRPIDLPPATATGGIIECDAVVKRRDALQDATHSPPKKVAATTIPHGKFYFCYFISHDTCDMELFNREPHVEVERDIAHFASSQGVCVLKTCHRFEVYSPRMLAGVVLQTWFLGRTYDILDDVAAIKRRIVNIYLGLYIYIYIYIYIYGYCVCMM